MEWSSLVTFRARAAKLPRLVSKTTEHDAPFPQFAHFARRDCTNLILAGRNTATCLHKFEFELAATQRTINLSELPSDGSDCRAPRRRNQLPRTLNNRSANSPSRFNRPIGNEQSGIVVSSTSHSKAEQRFPKRNNDDFQECLGCPLVCPRRPPRNRYLRHNLRADRSELDYVRIRSFFAISSEREGVILYSRCNFSGRARGVIHCFDLMYLQEEKRSWDAVVTRISLSLRPLES